MKFVGGGESDKATARITDRRWGRLPQILVEALMNRRPQAAVTVERRTDRRNNVFYGMTC